MNKKICFAASSGGHFAQLKKLAPLMKEYDSFIITEKIKDKPKQKNTYYLMQVNRKEVLCILYLIYNALVSLYILHKEKPDIIITTGVLAMIPLCLIGKIFHIKLIFIESFAKIKTPTKTGKFLYKYADIFIIQWEGLYKAYPNAVYLGGIY